MAKKEPLDEAVKDALTRIAARIFDKMKEADEVFVIEGMHQLPVMRHDSEFRQAPIDSSTEFMLSDVRVGARGQIIFCFEPVDDREYKHIEVEQRRMDSVFPLFAPTYAMEIGSTEENFERLIDVTAEILTQEHEAEEARKVEQALEAQENNRKLQNYGRF